MLLLTYKNYVRVWFMVVRQPTAELYGGSRGTEEQKKEIGHVNTPISLSYILSL
jgi:hypothetical protein